MSTVELSEQESIRRNSLEELNKLGINAFPAEEYEITHYSKDIKKIFEENEGTIQFLKGC
jgi:lysyl-tRNA synthetase class 2